MEKAITITIIIFILLAGESFLNAILLVFGFTIGYLIISSFIESIS